MQPQTYEIPYRCLLPKEVKNILVAGRTISATHEAMASTRVIPICMAIGQAAGTAAALSSINRISPLRLEVGKLKNKLIDDGCYISLTDCPLY